MVLHEVKLVALIFVFCSVDETITLSTTVYIIVRELSALMFGTLREIVWTLTPESVTETALDTVALREAKLEYR